MMFGYISSWAMVKYFIRYNNDILTQYFYPSVALTKEPFIVAISLLFIVLFTLLIELFQQMKILKPEKGGR
jgi:hypothetical protein